MKRERFGATSNVPGPCSIRSAQRVSVVGNRGNAAQLPPQAQNRRDITSLGIPYGQSSHVNVDISRARRGETEEGPMATQTQLVTGTDFITIATFYGEVLGLPFGKRWGQRPAGEFETGNLTIAVMQSDAFGVGFQTNNHPIALRVDDVPAARAELEARGVVFKGDILDSGVCHQAFFEDPDGNTLAIHHRYAPND
jgi:predicted enzyme related to lactoylglutathione lyase